MSMCVCVCLLVLSSKFGLFWVHGVCGLTFYDDVYGDFGAL